MLFRRPGATRFRKPGPMRVDVITLFPELVDGPLAGSIVGRARTRGLLELGFCNPRDFAKDNHRTVDDRPYGGGPGMLMMAEPLYQAVKKVKKRGSRVILLTPRGRRFDQALARELSKEKRLVLVCGHYEGFDERARDLADTEISIGDFVLTGGEPAAVVVIDAVTRLLPGVLKKADAAEKESFTANLLEAPQYTRPAVWRRKKVPAVLLSGDHAKIEAWRGREALRLTKKKRPDLL